jgi:hypothetical protein
MLTGIKGMASATFICCMFVFSSKDGGTPGSFTLGPSGINYFILMIITHVQ